MIADLLRAAALVVAAVALYNAACYALRRDWVCTSLSTFAAAALLTAIWLMGVATK